MRISRFHIFVSSAQAASYLREREVPKLYALFYLIPNHVLFPVLPKFPFRSQHGASNRWEGRVLLEGEQVGADPGRFRWEQMHAAQNVRQYLPPLRCGVRRDAFPHPTFDNCVHTFYLTVCARVVCSNIPLHYTRRLAIPCEFPVKLAASVRAYHTGDSVAAHNLLVQKGCGLH